MFSAMFSGFMRAIAFEKYQPGNCLQKISLLSGGMTKPPEALCVCGDLSTKKLRK